MTREQEFRKQTEEAKFEAFSVMCEKVNELEKENAELKEIKKLKELSKKYKGCRCSQYCSVWNSEDRDCEIMGEHHLSPSRCRWFLMQELRKGEETDG